MTWVPLGRHNPKVAELKAIGQRRLKHLTLVEGPKILRDLFLKRLYPVAIFATDKAAAKFEQDPVWACLPTPVSRFLLAEALFARVATTQHSQGVLAVYPVPELSSLAGNVLIYLDRLQDPANVGMVIRVAAALGASGLACSPGTADPFSPKAIRASAGWALVLPIMKDVAWKSFCLEVAPRHSLVGAATEAGVSAFRWAPQLPLALVLGNEGQGLAPDIEAQLEARVTIPLTRGVESLNVAVACGILLGQILGACQPPYTEKRGRKL